MHLGRPHERGEGGGNALQPAFGGGALLFGVFQRLPVGEHLAGGLGHRVAKDVGVAVDELFADTVAHRVEVKGALLGFHLAVERHLQKHVAQFLFQKMGVGEVDGFQRLVGLLDEIGADGAVGLLFVPGAAVVGVAQKGDDTHQVLGGIVLFLLKVDQAAHLLNRFLILLHAKWLFKPLCPYFCPIGAVFILLNKIRGK